MTRDVAYLEGWLRVEAAIARGEASVDELRRGRVGLAAIGPLRELERDGRVLAPVLVPALDEALTGIGHGTGAAA